MTQGGPPRADVVPTWQTELVALADGLYAYVQAGGGFCISNAGLIAGRAGSVVVDALFVPRMTRAFLAEVARQTTAPITTVITTHHHVDHTLGNHLFAGTTIIGHDLTRSEMARTGNPAARIAAVAPHFAPDLAEPIPIVPPNLTYSDRLTLYLDEREVQLIHVPTAHTIDDTLVSLPAERLLFAGDVAFFYVTPLAFEGSVLGWLDAIARIEAMDVERIVPGHGPVGGKAELALLRGYFELIRDQARAHYEAGRPAEQAVLAIDLGPYAAWAEPERIVPNVLRLYQDFSGAPWSPLDLTASRALQEAWLAQRR
ncbi:MAG: MBL fold metallo-hydrolase [Chloroflexota bacterium]